MYNTISTLFEWPSGLACYSYACEIYYLHALALDLILTLQEWDSINWFGVSVIAPAVFLQCYPNYCISLVVTLILP